MLIKKFQKGKHWKALKEIWAHPWKVIIIIERANFYIYQGNFKTSVQGKQTLFNFGKEDGDGRNNGYFILNC